MIEEPLEAKHYRDAQRLALIRLRDLEGALQHRLSKPLKYRMVSQAQAAPAERAYFLSNKAGAILPQPAFDAATTRSMIYNQSAAARQLEAFLQVSGVIILELCQATIRHSEAHEIAASYMMIRSMVERIAHVAALEDALRDFARATASPDKPSEPLILAADKIGKSLYGTRLDWLKLSKADLRVTTKEDLTYVRKQLTMDVSARNVLSSMDKLDKRVRGIRVSYDVLCEFLHPNVGDLYSATLKATSYSDAFGTRHVVREIGLGPKDSSTALDLVAVMSQVLSISCEAIQLLPAMMAELDVLSKKANDMAKGFAHVVRKSYKTLFRKDDLCPCLSGMTVRKCK